ncbi:MAG: M23 family metallopeptidase [Propionibacteriaceae bacterium]|jgi:murein DD-endopeptidase MepM/ murein hydrolase activator NlpD|nr:M23 family metallopeptidase [Propionibacteriaceae bacterium]
MKTHRIFRCVILWCICIATTLTVASPETTAMAAGSKVWPVNGSVIRKFEKPKEVWLPGHRGIDIASPAGTTVVAAAGGTVTWVGVIAGTPSISITHPDGVRTTYQPVNATVSMGQQVTVGSAIGQLQSGHAIRDCLHFGVLLGTVYLNPILWLIGASSGPVRLLPTDATIPLISPTLWKYLSGLI